MGGYLQRLCHRLLAGWRRAMARTAEGKALTYAQSTTADMGTDMGMGG